MDRIGKDRNELAGRGKDWIGSFISRDQDL